MSSITLASIETTVGHLFQAAAAFVVKAATTVATELKVIEPIALATVAAVAPQYSAAATVAISALNAIDGAVTAAGTAASGGVTVSLPAELVAAFQAAKAGLVAFESAL
jgi:hypothetical protein